jgi:hypothetical protein
LSRQDKYLKIRNSTGKTIVKGYITHATEDYDVQTIQINNLADGQDTDIYPIYTGPASRDYWYISWSHDGQNFIAFSNRNAANGHDSKGDPATIELRGYFGNSALAVWFHTDGSSTDKYDIKNPW